jgi:tRNA (cytidine32/uridine32-2'-O)-methyltransferase
VDVVLVRPQRPANVAAACRALKNMGLRSLVLVDAPPVPSEARALAYGAWDVLDGARRAATLREAVAPCALVVSTSGKADPLAMTPRELAARASALAGAGRMALVFGPESTGLHRDELDVCPWRVHIPADPAHASLNLAQAVLLLAYEIRLSAAAPPPAVLARPATSGELEEAMSALGEALLAVGYLNPSNPGAILAELRRLLARAQPTSREVVLLRGLARQVQWAGRNLAGGGMANT